MRYADGREKSAEFLRLAIPLMTQQAAALHPISYAVWYEYVSGVNRSLRDAIDDLRTRECVLDEETTRSLFRSHVADYDEEAAHKVTQDVQQVLDDMADSAKAAGQQASLFGSSLESWQQDMVSRGDDLGLERLLDDTRQMGTAIGLLKARLDESQDEVARLKVEVARAREDALSDQLTGLANRRGFDLALASCIAAKIPDTAGPSLLIADIDHFKRINDSYGHLFGDKVIRAVATVLKDNVKGRDIAARCGGEEFAILLPETSIDGARVVAEKIRATIAACRIKRLDDNSTINNVTVSLGVSCYQGGEAIGEFVARADSALYASKSGGRNRVTLAAAA